MNGNIGNDCKALYNIYMHTKTLSKALMFFGMDEIFQIIPSSNTKQLEENISDLFVCQNAHNSSLGELIVKPIDVNILTSNSNATKYFSFAKQDLESIPIDTQDIIEKSKTIDESTI